MFNKSEIIYEQEHSDSTDLQQGRSLPQPEQIPDLESQHGLSPIIEMTNQ